MRIESRVVELQLNQPFGTYHGSRTVQPSLLVSLSWDGHAGYGEAVATSYYGKQVTAFQQLLEQVRPLVENHKPDQPASLYHLLSPHLKDEPFLLAALDMAAWDLWGKTRGQSLRQIWGVADRLPPPSSYTIGLDQSEVMVEKLKARPWPIYKIKVGGPKDLHILSALREHTDSPFYIDANTGWTPEAFLIGMPELKKLGVTLVEQPLPISENTQMEGLYHQSPMPLVADESCQGLADIRACQGRFHGINIKLVKCGGLTPARQMIARARELGLKIMLGCMTESSVSISAAAQLAPLVDWIDLDGALLLRNDPATGVRLEHGRILYPDLAGTGASLRKGVL